MNKFITLICAAATVIPATALAHDTETAFASRGACEAANAAMSIGEVAWLTSNFPEFFDTQGEAASFLTRAWTCDRGAGGEFHITDHVEEVLTGGWYEQRNH